MSEVEDLCRQIKALNRNSKVKLDALCDAIKEPITVNGFLQRLNGLRKISGKQEFLRKSASRALYEMETSGLLLSQGGRGRSGKMYRASNTGIAHMMRIILRDLPTIGWSKHKWDSRRIVNSLVAELGKAEISRKEAKDVANRAEQSMLEIGWGQRNIGRPFLRQLLVETLKRIYEETDDYKYFRLARRFQPIAGTEKSIEDYIRTLKPDRIRKSPPEEYMREMYMLYKVEECIPLLANDCRLDITYIHGLLNAFDIFNFNHDFRFLLSNGISISYSSLQKPNDLRAALDFMVYGLALCQSNVAGSQTLDHWNWIIAPYLESREQEAQKLVENFVESLWMQYSVHPRAPLYSNIVLERVEDSSILHELAIEPSENKTMSTYATYKDKAHVLIDLILAALARREQLLDEARWHPTLFLRLSSKSLREISDAAIESIMQLIEKHTEKGVPHSIYFINMDSAVNNKPGHLTYFREMSRIFVSSPLADSQNAVFTFITINLLKVIAKAKKDGEWHGNLEDLVQILGQVVAQILAFNEKKSKLFDTRQATGQAGVFSIKNPSIGEYSFKSVNSSIKLGFFGFSDIMTESGLDIEKDISKLLEFLREFKEKADFISSELGCEHKMHIELAQTPSRSGAYSRLVSRKHVNLRFSHFSLTPFSIDRRTQLSIESKMHQTLLGGSVSRVYLDADEEPSNVGFLTNGKYDTETFRSFISSIMESSDIPLFQVIPAHKCPQGIYQVWGKLDPLVRSLRNKEL